LKYDQLLFSAAPCLCFGLAEAGFSGLKCGALLCRDGTALQSIYRCNWGVQPVHNLMPRNRAVNPAGNVEPRTFAPNFSRVYKTSVASGLTLPFSGS